MPLVKTLYEPIEKDHKKRSGVTVPIEKLVMILSEKIIIENPDYIIKAYADDSDKENLGL